MFQKWEKILKKPSSKEIHMQQLEAFFVHWNGETQGDICRTQAHKGTRWLYVSNSKSFQPKICLKIHVAAIALSLLRMIMY